MADHTPETLSDAAEVLSQLGWAVEACDGTQNWFRVSSPTLVRSGIRGFEQHAQGLVITAENALTHPDLSL